MRRERLGDLDVRITGGPDGRGGGDGPVVVLLHGFGAPGDGLVRLGKLLGLPAEVRFAFPEGPVVLPNSSGQARIWWMTDLERLQREMAAGRPRDRSNEVPEGMLPARARLCHTLDVLQERLAVPGERTVLGGFSQGSLHSCDVVLMTDRPMAGLVLLSTTLIASHAWVPAMSKRAGLPVFQSHGSMDGIAPVAAAERMRDVMRQAGMNVSWHEFDGGHEIPPQLLVALSSFLREILAL